MKLLSSFLVIASVLWVTGCGASVADIDTDRIIEADKEPHNWLSHGRTYDEQRYSPLKQISTDNVEQLGLAWFYDIKTDRGMEASPIVVDGMMFATGSWSVVFALNARTGEELWHYDPEVNREKGKDACCDVVNRGVAVWEGKVYVGALDGRLIALDASTGRELWSVQTTDTDKAYTITGAPRIVKNKVIIGNGGAEYGVRGYVSAYDVDNGELIWRFYTVPGDPSKPQHRPILEQAAETWSNEGEYWKVGGGGTVWDSMAYDPDQDLLYIGVGNGSPWNRDERSPGGGDNLFLSSVVALKVDTGEYVWHYQTTPGDNWDYTATQHIILADMVIGGEMRKVLMQAPKNGFFYVLDRVTGELLSAEKYEPKTNWALRIDKETGRPIENPEAVYGEQAKMVYPAPYGAHNWQPMAYNQDTSLVYIPVLEVPHFYKRDTNASYNRFNWNLGVDFSTLILDSPQTEAVQKATRALVRGSILAWDPVTQKEVWRVQNEHAWNGGMLTTAGNLLFHGAGAGEFAAYRADTGKKLWKYFAQTGIIAPPITYELDGDQYVSVLAGYGGAFALASGVTIPLKNHHKFGRVLTFKLNASAQLPMLDMADATKIPKPPRNKGNKRMHDRGALLYHQQCGVCHGSNVVGGGVLSDLRTMTAETHASFKAIVYDGAYKGKGMVAFSPVLSVEDVESVHAYIIKRANQDYKLLKKK